MYRHCFLRIFFGDSVPKNTKMLIGQSESISLCVLLLVLANVENAKCQNLFENTPNFYTPFDAWRKTFPPSHGTSFWPNFHNNYEPAFRDAGVDTFSGEERTEGPPDTTNQNPFEVDVISTGNVPSVQETDPNFFFHHSIPFFENYPFFSTFGGFGFNKRKEPWWKGPNVCTEREEDVVDDKQTEDTEAEVTDVEDINKPTPLFSGLLFSVNSCTEKPNKHVCKQVISQNGSKKTLTVTHQCCHGYGRRPNADMTTPCEKIDLKSIAATADELGAKEFIKSARNNGLEEKLLSNITLFLPTDTAFTEFSEQMFENNLVVLPLKRTRRATSDTSGITTKELALNHMVDGWVNMDDVRNEELLTTNFENATIRINIFPRPPNNKDFEYAFRYTANCAPILKVNKVTTNGLLHVVDRVLSPVHQSVMDIIRSRSDMAVLKTILEKTKLSELLEGDKPVTIFAPTDKAFEKLDMHLRRTLKEGRGCATNILKNHILDLTFCTVAVVPDAKTTAYNVLGQAMSFERSSLNDQQMQGTEISDLSGIQDVIVNGQAKITESDIMGTNGVVHVVDAIMPTETALPITSLLEKKNLTVFKQLIEAADLQDQYDDLSNVTYFAPSDKAFEGSYWQQQLQENPQSLRGNPELKEFLQYHVVEPMIKTCDLSEKSIPTKSGAPLRVNLYSTHPLFSDVMNRATVNCARLVHFDHESCGSVLHQVDKVLSPPNNNLLQILEANPEYSMFVKLIKDANLTQLLETEDDSYTVLVPKNDVFLEVEDWYQNLSGRKEDIQAIAASHIVNDVVCCAGIIPTNWPFVRTIETINKKGLRISRDRRPKIENAGVTKCDIIAKNGIIHEINDVIQVKQRPTVDRHPIHDFGSFPF